MPIYVAMLRGINVGSRNRIKMDVLRSVFESVGCRGCETYIQSGNVVFSGGGCGPARLEKQLQGALEQAFQFRPAVILRSQEELKETVEKAPFLDRPDFDGAKLLIYFLRSDPGSEARTAINALETGPEKLQLDGRELFIYYPNGMARPKLPMKSVEKMLQMPGTGRNWNTVTKLVEMCRLRDP
jgi:uncharacterized protein (DUF1697 family)